MLRGQPWNASVVGLESADLSVSAASRVFLCRSGGGQRRVARIGDAWGVSDLGTLQWLWVQFG